MIDRRNLLRTAGALLASAVGWRGTAGAHQYNAGMLSIENPWLRAPREGEKSARLYMFIANKSDQPDRLKGVRSAGVGSAEAHVAPHFAERADAIYIPPLAKVTLAPGGSYVELLDIAKMNPVGWGCEMTLIFEKAGEVVIDASIDAPDATHAHDAEAMERWRRARGEASSGQQEAPGQPMERRSTDQDGGAAPPPNEE
jgi:copper(I)-binding protein